MAPRPSGFKVMFQLGEHGGSDAEIGVRFQLILGCLPAALGPKAAHRRKRQRSRGPTNHVCQAEVIEVVRTIFACD
jgi:hypothetical protein